MRTLATTVLCYLLLTSPLLGPTFACTSFCLDTPDGSFFAINLDLSFGEGLVFVNRRGIAKEGYLQSTTGETAKWTSRYGSVTFNAAGREFAWSGMNEAGLVVGSVELRASTLPQPDERAPVGVGYWVQYVLDNCGTVTLCSNHCKPSDPLNLPVQTDRCMKRQVSIAADNLLRYHK